MNKVEHYVQPSAGNPHAWLGWSALCWGDLLRRTLVLALAGFACTTCVAVEYFVRQNG